MCGYKLCTCEILNIRLFDHFNEHFENISFIIRIMYMYIKKEIKINVLSVLDNVKKNTQARIWT